MRRRKRSETEEEEKERLIKRRKMNSSLIIQIGDFLLSSMYLFFPYWALSKQRWPGLFIFISPGDIVSYARV